MKRVLFILLLGLVFVSSCKPKERVAVQEEESNTYFDGKIEFINSEDLITALEYAEEEGKPLFVEFEAEWCLPCQVMSTEVFTHQETADFFNENFINYKVDVEEQSGANMKMLYGVNIIPTLIFMDHKGKSLSRNDGSLMHKSLVNLGNEALSRWEVVKMNQ